jgi:toxin ParE1/3/4
MGEIRWTKKASNNLQAIYIYIARDSETYALRFVKSLINAVTKLEIAPYCGRLVPELFNYGFREVIYRNYRIVYQVLGDNKDIEVLAVVHSAREMKTMFHEEWELN